MSEIGRKALLVVNSQSHAGRDYRPYAEALQQSGLTLIRRECSRDKLAELIMSMRAEVGTVILAGGDGTVSAGAIALRDTGLPLGIIPLGRNNELATRLALPTDPGDVAATILAGRTRRLDLGTVNGRPFFNVASVGLTIHTARMLQRASHARTGRLGYLLKAARVAFNGTRFTAIVRCGAIVHRVRTIQVTIGNGRVYKAGVAPDALGPTDDGRLFVYSLEPGSKWHILGFYGAFAGDEADLPDTRTTSSPVVEVVTRLPQPISADGEVVTVTPARFSILKDAVSVLVPAEPPAPDPELDPEAAPDPA